MSAICEIEYENSPFYAGQLIRGAVIVKLYEGTVVSGVYLRLYGEAFYMFQEKTGSSYTTGKKTENHLDEKIVCVSGAKGKTLLQEGTHRFPFKCQLPIGIPTSVEEWRDPFRKYKISVRYTASVHFNESMEEPPIHEEIFGVIKPLNLNSVPNSSEPLLEEYKQRFNRCCCFPCFKSDYLRITGHCSQQGYAPGQNIDLQLDVSNKSSEKIKCLKVKLLRVFSSFIVTGAGRKRDVERTTELFSKSLEKCNKNELKTYNVTIPVPPTPPTDASSPDLHMKTFYKILVECRVGRCHVYPKLEMFVTIGTYPNIKSKNSDRAVFADLPTYEVTIYGEDNKNDGFEPKYPVYRRKK